MRKRNKACIIAIDIRPYQKDPSGMGQYVYEITKHLLKNDTAHKFLLLSDSGKEIDFTGNFQVKIFKVPFLPEDMRMLHTIYFHVCTVLFARFLCDRYITTSALYVPAFTRDLGIVVVHDLTIFSFPDLHTKKTKRLIGWFLKPALLHANHIITVSENTKKDLLRMFPEVPSKKVTVIYLGTNDALTRLIHTGEKNDWPAIAEKFHINGGYILFVGTTEPRKNISTVIKAFRILAQTHPLIQLVIAGKEGWGIHEIKEQISLLASEVKQRIIITGYISEKEKAYLYAHAVFMVYPSLYEGFGIPVLEAMSFGIPVITSNTSSLPEVAGNAALLVNPIDAESIAANMLQLLTEKDLREALITKGKERVQFFDWNKAAKQFISILN